MPAVLTEALVRSAPRRWPWWVYPLAVMLAGVALVGATIAAEGQLGDDAYCTPPEPGCEEDWIGAGITGLTLGVVIAAFVDVWGAALLSWALAGLVVATEPAAPWYPAWVPVGHVVFALVVTGIAWYGTWADRRVVAAVLGTTPVEPPTPPRQVPLAQVRWAVAAGALLIAGVMFLGWGIQEQRREEAREAAADRISGTVVSLDHNADEEYTAKVQLDGRDGTIEVPVDYPEDLPVGGRTEVYIGEDGLRRLVSTPHDATHWAILAALVFAGGIGSAARFTRINLALRRLLRRPQPVFTARVRPGNAFAAVYTSDARSGEDALLELPPVPPADPADPRLTEEDSWASDRLATVIGAPLVGAWCTVRIGEYLLIPTGPARGGDEAPPAGLIDDEDDEDE